RLSEAMAAGELSRARKGGAKSVLSSSLPAGPPPGMRSFAMRNPLLGPPTPRISRSHFQRVTLQGRPAVVEQTQLDQFLFQLFSRRAVERVGHFVQQQISKLFPGAVKDLSNADSGKGPVELGGEVLCHLRGPQLGMLGPETEYGMVGLAGP